MSVMGYGGLKFGSLDEVIKADDFWCALTKARECKRRGPSCALNEEKTKEVNACPRQKIGGRLEEAELTLYRVEWPGLPERPTAR